MTGALGGGLEVARLFGTLGLDKSGWDRGLNEAGSQGEAFGSRLVGSFQRIAETAAGVLIGNMLPKLIGGFQNLAMEGLQAVASQERLGMALENLTKRDLIAASTTEQLVKVGQARVTLTAQEREKVDDLVRSRDILAIRMKEEELRHQELIKRYGEEGLATQRHALEMAGLRDKYGELNSAIGKLEAKNGSLVDQFKKVTNQTLTDAQAKEMAAKASKDLLGWIERLAVQSPFEADDVAAAFKTASAYGFMANAAADLAVKSGKLTQAQRDNTVTAERLTQAMIDFAAGAGAAPETMNRVALALGQIQARGKLAGQEVMQLTEAGISVDKILATAFGKSTAEIIAMREKGLIPADKAILAITQSLEKDFGGAAKAQTQTFAGLMSSMADLKKIGVREFFEGTFKAIQPYLASFVDWLGSDATKAAITALGELLGTKLAGALQTVQNLLGAFQTGGVGGLAAALGLTPAVGELVQRIADGLAGLGTTVRDGIGAALDWLGQNVMPAVNTAIQFVVDNWPAFEGALQGIGAALVAGGVIAAVAGLAGGMLSLVNPVTLLIGLAAGIGAAWATNFGGIRDVVQPILDGLAATFETIKTKFGEVVAAFQTGGLAGALGELGAPKQVLDDLAATFETIKTKFGEVVAAFQTGGLAGALGELGVSLEPLRQIGDFLAATFQPTFERLAAGFQEMVAGLPDLKPLLDDLWAAFQELLAALEPVAAVIAGVLVGAFNLLLEIVGNVMGSLPDLIGNSIKIVTEIFNGLADLVRGVVEIITNLIQGDFAGAWEAAKTMVSSLWDHISNIFATMADTIVTLGQNVIEAVKTWVENFIGKVKELFGIASPSTVFGDIGKSLLDGLLAGINGMAATVIEGVKGFFETNVKKALAWLEFLKQAGQDLIGGGWQGIASKAGELLKNVQGFFETNVRKALDFAAVLVDAGKSIVSGLWQGIQDMGQWFKDQFIAWLRTWVPGPVLDFLGIHSPSRMFFEIGRQIVLGLLEGIASLSPETQATMMDVAQGIVGALNSIVGVLDALNKAAPVAQLREKLRMLGDHLKAIVDFFRQLGDFYGAGPNRWGLEKALGITDLLGEVVSAMGSALSTVKGLTELESLDRLTEKVQAVGRAIVEIVTAMAGMATTLPADLRERAKRIAADLGVLFDSIGAVFDPLLSALAVLRELELGPVPAVQERVLELIEVVLALAEGLADAVARVGEDTLVKAADAAELVAKLVAPWEQMVQVVEALAAYQARISASVEGGTTGAVWRETVQALLDMVWMLAEELGRLRDELGQGGLLEAAGQVAAALEAILRPWEQAIKVVEALGTMAPAGSSTEGGSAVTWLVGQVQEMAAGLAQVMDTLGAETLRKASQAGALVTQIVQPWAAMVKAVEAIGEHTDQVIGPMANRLAGQMGLLGRLLGEMAGALGDDEMRRATEAATQFSTILGPWEKAVKVMEAIGEHTDQVIGPMANRLAGQMGLLGRLLGEMVGALGEEEMRRATEAAARFSTILGPWEKAVKVVEAIGEHTDQVIGPMANRLAGQMGLLGRLLGEMAGALGEDDLRRATEAAAQFSAILGPWEKAVKVVEAIGEHTDQVIGPLARRLGEQMQGLARMLLQAASVFGEDDLRRAGEVAAQFSAILAPWEKAVQVVEAVADHTDRAIGPLANRLAGQMQGLARMLLQAASVFGEDDLRRAGEVAAQFDAVLAPWEKAVQVVAAVADHTDRAIGPLANRLAGQMQGLARALDLWARELGEDAMRRAVQAAHDFTAVLEPWEKAIKAVDALRAWRLMPDIDDKLARFLRFWRDAIEQLAKAVRLVDEDGLSLVARFGETLGALAEGLQSAVTTALALPEGWQVPAAWGAFQDWVLAVFQSFYDWVNDWGDPPLPLFTSGGLDLIGQFAEVLGGLMGALQSALELATALPATWEVPAAWAAFQAWVQDVFMGFYQWIINWGDKQAPVPIFDDGVLDLIGQFAEVLGGLMGALKTALDLALALPATWEVPAAWAAFQTWVQDVFMAFYQWIINWGDKQAPVPIFDDGVLDLIGQFAEVLGGLMGALKTALELATALPATWEVPAAWAAFQTWVQDVFMGFYQWVNSWGDPPVPQFTGSGLDLIGQFGQALGALFDGLQSALELATTLPATWEVPAAWAAFQTWVQDVFMGFYQWVNSWGDPPVPQFTGSGLDLIGQFGQALGALFGGLQSALELATTLPATWEVPAAWAAFQTWVQDVFMGFYQWVNSWGDPPVPQFTGSGLDLIGQFGQALGALFGGLQSALELVAALPATWVVADTWNDFVTWVQAVFTSFQTYVAAHVDAGTAGSEAFAAVQSFGNALGALFNGLVAALTLFEGLQSWVGPSSVFQQRLTAFLETVQAAVTTMSAYVQANFTTDVMATLAAFGSALQALVGGLSATLDLMQQLADTDPSVYTESTQFAQRVSALMQAIGGTITAFRTYIATESNQLWLPTANEFMSAVSGMMGVLRTALDLFEELNQAGLPDPATLDAFVQAVLGLFAQFTAGLQGSQQQIGTTAGQINSTVQGVPPLLGSNQNAFTDVGGALATALVNGIDLANAALAAMAGTISTNIQAVADFLLASPGVAQFWQVGANIGQRLVEGLLAQGTQTLITDAGNTMATTLYNAVYPRTAGDAWWVGTQAVAGLVAGLADPNSTVWSAAYALAMQILAGLGAGLNTGSPSRRTMQVGEWAGEGLAQGMANQVGLVTSAATDMAEAVMDGLSGGLQGLSGTVTPLIRRALSWGQVDVAERLGRLMAGGFVTGWTGSRPALAALQSLTMGPAIYGGAGNDLHIESTRRVHIKVDFDGVEYLPPAMMEAIKVELIRAVRTNA